MRTRYPRGLVLLATSALLGSLFINCSSRNEPAASKKTPPVSVENYPLLQKRPTFTVTGTVSGTDAGANVPAAGALVLLVEQSLDGGAYARPGQTPAPLIASADATGAWSLADVPAGAYRITAAAPGWLAGPGQELTLGPDAGKPPSAVNLTLERGGVTVSGRITDPRDQPVSDALALVSTYSGKPEERWIRAARSAADGSYQLNLAPGIHTVEVVHDSYTRWRQHIEVSTQAVAVNVRLEPAVAVKGKVVTADGTPLAGALVTARTEGHSIVWDDPAVSGNGMDSAVSGNDGSFVLKRVRPGLVHVRAVHPRWASRQPALVELGVGEQVADVLVALQAAVVVRGKVSLMGNSERPAPGRFLALRDHARDVIVCNTHPSADDGTFAIYGVPPGVYELAEFGRTLAGPSLSLEPPRPIIHVSAADVTAAALAIDPRDQGVTVRVRVEPPGPAEIAIEATSENSMIIHSRMPRHLYRTHRTGDDGRLALTTVPAGYYMLTARTDDGKVGNSPLVVEDNDVPEVVIQLEQRGTITGTIVKPGAKTEAKPEAKTGGKPGGDPLAAANLHLARKYLDPLGLQPYRLEHLRGRTGPDGSFRFTGLVAGEYTLSVSDETGTVPWAGKEEMEGWAPFVIQLEKGAVKNVGVLEVEAFTQTMTGSVSGPDGKPRANVWVEAEKTPFMTTILTAELEPREITQQFVSGSRTLTDARGRFQLSGLRPGVHAVAARDPKDGSSASVAEVKPGQEAALTLSRPGRIHGQVRVHKQPHVSDFVVEVYGETGTRRWFSNKDGQFEVNRLEPEAYSLGIASAQGVGVADVEVTGEPTKPVTVDVKRWASITGQLVDAVSGAPIADVEVRVNPLKGEGSELARMSYHTQEEAVTDAQGRFRIDRVLPGARSLWVPDRGGVGTSLAGRELIVPAGETADVGIWKGRISLPREEWFVGFHLRAATVTNMHESGDKVVAPLDAPADREYLWVSRVQPDSPAARAGVKVLDRIVAINGYKVAEVGAEPLDGLASIGRGLATYVLDIDRGGQKLTVTVKGEEVSEPESDE